VDEGGNLFFTINDLTGSKILAKWNNIEGNGYNYDTLALATGDADWLTFVKSSGDILDGKAGSAVYTMSWGNPIAKVYLNNPPIVENPIGNKMAKTGTENLIIDLSNVFAHPGNEADFTYQVIVNSDPSVATTTLSNNQLEISFLSPGQTNVSLQATSHGLSVSNEFVIGVQPVISGEYAVSYFEGLLSESESFWNGSDGSGGFESGLGFFQNNFNANWGSWSGWSYSNITDNTTSGWTNQYSAITGSGMDPELDYGDTYAVGYNPKIGFNNPSAHLVKGMFVTNSTYAALNIKNGDAFSKKFGGENGNDPDWFMLTARGMKDGAETGSIDFYLADFQFEDNTKDYVIETWQWMDLSSLGKIDSIMLNLTSSDVGIYGMNTPAYVAIDNVYIVPDLAPVVSSPIENINAHLQSEPATVNLDGVFTDPDDDDSKIVISIKENSNIELVTPAIENNILTLSFTENKTGTAEITLLALSNGKTVEESFMVTVESGTSTDQLQADRLQVYPNPSNGRFQITYIHDDQLKNVEIYNLTGQLIYQNSHLSDGQIDLGSAKPGTYLLRIIKGQELIQTRIVIQ
jgi:hypothetical protein